MLLRPISTVQSGWSVCCTGNREKLSNIQVCCLAQMSLAAAQFLSVSCATSTLYRSVKRLPSSHKWCEIFHFYDPEAVEKNIFGPWATQYFVSTVTHMLGTKVFRARTSRCSHTLCCYNILVRDKKARARLLLPHHLLKSPIDPCTKKKVAEKKTSIVQSQRAYE